MKKGKLKLFLKAVGLGVIDSVPLLSSIKNNVETAHKATEEKPNEGKGKIDFIRLFIAILSTAAIIYFAFGKITYEQMHEILETIKNF